MNCKCSHVECAREATKRYLGRSTPGRAPGNARGVPYCSAHYEQIRRGGEPGALRPRGKLGPYRAGVEDAASIVEFHGQHELAALLRRLNQRKREKEP